MDNKATNKLRREYPNFTPLKVASELLGVSPRQLSKLVAEGRKPFCLLGANIGTRQRYIRIYTGPDVGSALIGFRVISFDSSK